MKKFAVEMDEMLETGIPPTWLFIDEAHTLIPSGSKTAASDSLIEYVKQGRRPGCSLVFATQQPAAIDSKVLSQLDLLLCHKLVFEDDLKAVFKRIPSMIPQEYKDSKFIRRLPIGACMIGDRSDHTSRAFTIKVRPRFSQHEGREARSVKLEEGMKPEEVKSTLEKMVWKKIQDQKRVHIRQIDQLVRTINKRYDTEVSSPEIIEKILEKDCVRKDDYLVLSSEAEAEEKRELEEMEEEGLLAFQRRITPSQARKIVQAKKKNKLFGLFGTQEEVQDFFLEYWPVYKIEYDYYEKNGFRRSQCYVDGMSGELLRVRKGNLESTEKVNDLLSMPPEKRGVITGLRKGKKASVKSLSKFSGMSRKATSQECEELVEEGILGKEKKNTYYLKKDFGLPESLVGHQYTSLESELVLNEEKGRTVKPLVGKESVKDIPSLYGEVKTRQISLLYKPVYHAVLVSDEEGRDLFLDGMTGQVTQKEKS